ncbi:helix-turn-helix transcriptional regulator [Mycolicibacterium thermoresistibile]
MTERPKRRRGIAGLLPLAVIRERAGLRQTEVGDRIGMAQSNLSRLESGGTDPTASVLLRYLRSLGGTVTITITSRRAWMTHSPAEQQSPADAVPIDLALLGDQDSHTTYTVDSGGTDQPSATNEEDQ